MPKRARPSVKSVPNGFYFPGRRNKDYSENQDFQQDRVSRLKLAGAPK